LSTQGTITEFLSRFGADATGDYIAITPAAISLQLGVERDLVSKTLYNLSHTGKIDLVRGSNNRDVVGYKIIDLSDRRGQSPQPGVRAARAAGVAKRAAARPRKVPAILAVLAAPQKPAGLKTPATDDYARAKKKFEALQHDFGDYVEASFKANPFGEEALALRDRLAVVEQELATTKRENDEAQRDLKVLRGRSHAAMAESVERSGAAVVHAD